MQDSGPNRFVVSGTNYHHHTLSMALTFLYKSLLKGQDITSASIDVTYMGVTMTTFKISFNKKLILYNDHDCISASSIDPSLALLDLVYQEKLLKNKNIPVNSVPNVKIRHEKFLSNKETLKKMHINQAWKQENIQVPIQDTETFDSNKNKDNLEKMNIINQPWNQEDMQVLTQNNTETFDSEQLTLFKSDKESYIKLQKDIYEGRMDVDRIHPAYKLKYSLFKILESRGSLNSSSDANIQSEYDVFTLLYDSCKEDYEKEEIENETQRAIYYSSHNHPNEKGYLPHNYNYLPTINEDDKKRKYDPEYEKKFIEAWRNGTLEKEFNFVNLDASTSRK